MQNTFLLQLLLLAAILSAVGNTVCSQSCAKSRQPTFLNEQNNLTKLKMYLVKAIKEVDKLNLQQKITLAPPEKNIIPKMAAIPKKIPIIESTSCQSSNLKQKNVNRFLERPRRKINKQQRKPRKLTCNKSHKKCLQPSKNRHNECGKGKSKESEIFIVVKKSRENPFSFIKTTKSKFEAAMKSNDGKFTPDLNYRPFKVLGDIWENLKNVLLHTCRSDCAHSLNASPELFQKEAPNDKKCTKCPNQA